MTDRRPTINALLVVAVALAVLWLLASPVRHIAAVDITAVDEPAARA